MKFAGGEQSIDGHTQKCLGGNCLFRGWLMWSPEGVPGFFPQEYSNSRSHFLHCHHRTRPHCHLLPLLALIKVKGKTKVTIYYPSRNLSVLLHYSAEIEKALKYRVAERISSGWEPFHSRVCMSRINYTILLQLVHSILIKHHCLSVTVLGTRVFCQGGTSPRPCSKSDNKAVRSGETVEELRSEVMGHKVRGKCFFQHSEERRRHWTATS